MVGLLWLSFKFNIEVGLLKISPVHLILYLTVNEKYFVGGLKILLLLQKP